MHPYTVAKMVASLGYMYRREVYLNMLAGGFKNDLVALGDATPHDERYERTTEYTTIINRLLEDTGAVTFDGKYYQVKNLRLTPPLPEELRPRVLISGSSAAGIAAAKAIGATPVKYPKPPGEYEGDPPDEHRDAGVRVGIIAREDSNDAWRIARERFPEDRKGQLAHQLAMKTSDSVWHRQLSELGQQNGANPYWLTPFQHYKTFCPYLVGSIAEVAQEVGRYVALGFRTFIVDIPPCEEELYYTEQVFKLSVKSAEKCRASE
jgi:alkanesulfonate monooxygenase